MSTLPPELTLRRATPEDLVPFADLSRRTFIDTFAAFQTPERMARHVAQTLSDERLGRQLADPARTTWALLHGEAWAGYVMLHVGDSPAEVVAATPVEIERFYVEREWHGRGVAAALMESTLQFARSAGHDAAWLGVWETNPRAIRFYEKHGFTIVGAQVYVFDDVPENDHIMARSL